MPSDATQSVDVANHGAGMTGIATAFYLAKQHDIKDSVLIDAEQPFGFTSAQSGDNDRNWGPHPDMVALSNRSIE